MMESSTTLIPGANTHRPLVESGIEPMSLVEEAQRAAESANKQSTKRTPHVKET